MRADYPQLEITSAAQLRKWLLANYDRVEGIWPVTYKKASGKQHVSYEEVVREALCFGWIDSQGKPLDATRSQLLLTPRRPKSKWSGPNKARVAELTAAGVMHPPGQAMIDLAKRTGTWTALDDVEALIEPAELRAALDAHPDARRHWDGFPRSTRRAILEWIGSAKRPETGSEADRGNGAPGGSKCPGQSVATFLEDGPGIENAEWVEGVLDRP